MRSDGTPEPWITDHIAAALRTVGGHLFVGPNGYILRSKGRSLHGYDTEPVKQACVAAGVPVIDARWIDYGDLCRLVIAGPMIAVGGHPSDPPWGPLGYAPLAAVATAYRAAGAEVLNLPLG